MSLIPQNWAGGDAEETWKVEIEHDRMDSAEPFVVTISTQHHDHGEGSHHDTLVCASPEQAREMAAALLVYAHMAEQANAALPFRDQEQTNEGTRG